MEELYIINNISLFLNSVKNKYNIIEIFSINDYNTIYCSNYLVNEYNIKIKYKIPCMDRINNAIKIQKIWRGYKQRKKVLIASSFIQTKKWRETQSWYKNGKYND